MLLAAALGCVAGRARGAVPNGATLLIAGPQDGATAAWADVLVPALMKSLPAGFALARENVGAADGVTGANQFQARTPLDGGTVLLLPGRAALAWLIGDPRAQFDAAQWVTALAGTTPAVIASRLPLEQIVSGGAVRVAGAPDGPTLAALLTLDLMGAIPQPVPVVGPDYAGVDAVLLSGRAMSAQVASAARFGFRPVLRLGGVGATSGAARLPEAVDRIKIGASPGLIVAWRAVIAATRLDTALVLAPLTPASMVAIWRRAGVQAAENPGVQAAAARFGVRPETEADAVASTAPIAVDASAMLDLRAWLLQRFGWRPRSS